MEVFARLVKSIIIALALITLGLVVLVLLAWTKGLFMLLAVFGLAVVSGILLWLASGDDFPGGGLVGV